MSRSPLPVYRLLALWMALALVLPLVARAGDASGYRLGPRDVVHVDVYGEEDLSGTATIGPDGTVFVPLLGPVQIGGLTPHEAAARITERLADGYLVSPQVAVEVQQYLSQKVAVVGAVKRPGEYYLDGPTHLLDVLARAGNIDAEKSAREIRVRRADGQTVVVAVDALLATGEGDIELRAGDLVSVPEGQFVYVAGEVAKPGAIVFWEGLTVTQALTKAGGPSALAQLKGAYILRGGERIPVNLRRILGGRESDMDLRPGDQLVLRQSPI